MYARYKLTVRIDSIIVFQRYFQSINQVIKVAIGFDDSCYISIFDDLTQQVFANSTIRALIKEFRDVEILS